MITGQKRRRDLIWPGLMEGLAQGRTVGIINVVSYGYHTFREARMEDITSVYQPDMTPQAFLNVYAQNRREEELAIVRDLVQPMTVRNPNLWMMTVVTKQDLWWLHSAAVSAYYETGEYNRSIEEIMSRRGNTNFPHEYHAASLIMNNFRTGDGVVLAPTVEGYDQTIQYAYWKRLLDSLNAQAQRMDKHG